MSNSSVKKDDQLQKYSRPEIYWQVGASLVSIALLVVFLFGDFQINVPGINLGLSSINCWVLSDSERTARKAYEDSIKPDAEYDKKLTEARDKFDPKEKDLKLTDRKVTLETNFGNMTIETLNDQAPVLSENFLRLVNRGYYDNTVFHRIVKEDNFKVIQGGDPEGTGQGGDSAFNFDLKDEIKRDNGGKVSCNAKFNEPITYQKAYVAMANRGANTNGSQFFIMLEDTKLPPNYSIFAKVTGGVEVLDKIKNDVKAVDEAGAEAQDGKPDKEIKITKAKLD
ncbi:MAG: peptidylprolyl isomerase [Patescibacteria group bacterium]